MRYLLLLFIGLLWFNTLKAQPLSLPDSLQNQLVLIQGDSAKAAWLLERAGHFFWADLGLSSKLARTAYDQLKATDEELLKGKASERLAMVYYQERDHDLAIEKLKEAVQQYEKAGDKLAAAYAMVRWSKSHLGLNQQDEALDRIFKALEIFENMNEPAGIARCYEEICEQYRLFNQKEKGIEYGRKAIAIQEKNGLDEDLSYACVSLAYLFFDTETEGAIDTVLKYSKKARAARAKVENNDPLHFVDIDNLLGNAYKFKEQYDSSLFYYNQNLEVGRDVGHQSLISVSLANIGHAYFLQEKYQQAIPFVKEGVEIAEALGEQMNLSENYNTLSISYARVGEFEEAYRYQKLHQEVDSIILNNQIRNLEAESLVKYETGKKDEMIAQQEQRLRTQRKIQFLIGGVALLLLAVIFLLFRNYRNKQKSNEHLRQLNAELARKIEENELLLKEIHHRVKNNLQVISSLLSLQSAHISDPKVLGAVQESQNRVKSMGLIHQKLYQGENLAAVEMKDYLKALGESMRDAFGERAENVDIQCRMDELELDVDTAIPIGLIVNELLTNSLKYAFPDGQKGTIKISIDLDSSKQLRLVVEDNGVGTVSSTPQGTGFGGQLITLLTMQLNGKMKQENKEGLYTEICFNRYKRA